MGRYLGEFEHTVLVGLLRCGGEATGGQVHEEIARVSGRDASLSAVYVTLKRMGEKGYVHALEPRPLASSMGRGRKRYTLTRDGAAELARTRDLFERLWSGVDVPGLQGT